MKRRWLSIALLAAALNHSAFADNLDSDSRSDHDKGNQPITVAVFGDWPYNQLLLDSAPLLIKSVNRDKDVSMIIHVGDIHSGSMPCTGAGYFPIATNPANTTSASAPASTAVPDWNQKIYHQFQQFKMPLVYTPGDNEWTDCQKPKELSSGAPLKELASIRALFFAKPGKTLGGTERQVLSQAMAYDPAYPTDAQFVENMMWDDGKVVFATLNMPGSNNDTLPWAVPFVDTQNQQNEVNQRTNADIRWLQAAFKRAADTHARAVVISLQADMWDPAAWPTYTPGADGLSAYTPFVQQLADLTVQFGKPVLLLNGDSHSYEADHPLMPNNTTNGFNTYNIHPVSQPVPNLTRITVQGSTNAPAEWLRLVIDTRNEAKPFSFTNVPYCANPLASTCQ